MENYQLYEDNRLEAEAVLQQEHQAGWLTWHPNRQALERACGKPMARSLGEEPRCGAGFFPLSQPDRARSWRTSTRWSDADLETLQVQRGNPQGQARLEAFTLLIAINTWRRLLVEAQGRLAIRGDALGVLQDVVKMRARDPRLNDITSEIALFLEALQFRSGFQLRAYQECRLRCRERRSIGWPAPVESLRPKRKRYHETS